MEYRKVLLLIVVAGVFLKNTPRWIICGTRELSYKIKNCKGYLNATVKFVPQGSVTDRVFPISSKNLLVGAFLKMLSQVSVVDNLL